MQIVVVANQKGGVGKTVTVMALAAIAAEAGQRVLVVDVDPQGSAGWWAERLPDAPFDFTANTDPAVLQQLRAVAGYDVVFVDTPGSLEARNVLRAVVASADYVVVPTEVKGLAVVPTITTVRQIIEPASRPYRVLFTRVDGRSPADLESGRGMLNDAHIPSFSSCISYLKIHDEASTNGELITQVRGRQTIRALGEYRAVALELFGDWARSAVATDSRINTTGDATPATSLAPAAVTGVDHGQN